MLLSIEIKFAQSFESTYEDAIDLRFNFKPSLIAGISENAASYQQVFQEKTGFLPNLSLLDLLFAEGPYALKWLNAFQKTNSY